MSRDRHRWRWVPSLFCFLKPRRPTTRPTAKHERRATGLGYRPSVPWTLFPVPCFLNVAACLAALLKIALVVLFGTPESLRRFNERHYALGLEAAFGREL